jgi:hypothetical protein
MRKGQCFPALSERGRGEARKGGGKGEAETGLPLPLVAAAAAAAAAATSAAFAATAAACWATVGTSKQQFRKQQQLAKFGMAAVSDVELSSLGQARSWAMTVIGPIARGALGSKAHGGGLARPKNKIKKIKNRR